VIVEDEAPARRELRRMLDADARVRVLGEAADLDTARGLLERTRPDLLFLDIRLGRESGFELLEHVDPEVAVVFVTAYDEHAVRAFEAHAMDYLMKPVEPGRLRRSIDHVLDASRQREATGPSAAQATGASLFTSSRWVFLDGGQVPEFLELDRIIRIQADGTRSIVQTADGLSRPDARSLREWQARLPSDFLRIHRATIVNLRHVERVEPWSHYGYRVHLRGSNEPAAMSRRYAVRVKDLLR
jgi:two-component system LytT family response regulator